MANSRSKNAMLNIFFGYIAQLGILILSFVGRKIFLQFLSVEYLGVNGLFSNILTVLSLPELGLDTAVVFSLYKPVAEDNRSLIYSLIRYFKKIYITLAIVIFSVGVAIVPFLKYIVNSDLSQTELNIYYLLFLANTVATYFVAHKVALLSACQEQRVQKIVALSTNLIAQVLHIVVLYIWGNYYVYIIATLLTTIVNSVVLGVICDRRHKDILFCTKEIEKIDTDSIKRRIFSTLLYKLGSVAINNTDNILISVLVSTVAVGLYSNYFTVISAVQGFITIITVSLISGIGNLVVKATIEKQYSFFKAILFGYHFIAALIGIGFALCFNDLITLWLGEEYLLNNLTVLVIALNFYLTNAISPVYMYREANGLFEKVRYLMLIRAICNIVFSVILGKLWGVMGILFATTISLIITNFWFEPKVLFKTTFGLSSVKYWKIQLKYLVLMIISFAISCFITLSFDVNFMFLALKVVIITIITALVFILLNIRNDEVKYLFNVLKRFINKKK